MLTFALQSGSCGNCFYVESRGVKLLFDAGIPWRLAVERMAAHRTTPDGVAGIFISHDHSDHFGSAGVFHRKTKAPLFMSQGTAASLLGGNFAASPAEEIAECADLGDDDDVEVPQGSWRARPRSENRLGRCRQVETFSCGDTIQIAHLRVTTVATPHDASDPCAFVVDDGESRLGILSDLGHGFAGLVDCLADLDAAYLESNYEESVLAANYAYPEVLKRRIRGRRGHLENTESAKLVQTCAAGRLQTVILCHLSGENNSPSLALAAHRRAQAEPTFFTPPPPRLLVSPRDAASPRVTI